MNTAGLDHNLFRVPERQNFQNAVVAIIVLDDGRYLAQLRDDKPGIFYPDHWGLFGGAVDPGESPEAALRRELMEELSLEAGPLSYFTRMDFDFARLGAGKAYRIYYEVPLAASALSSLRLGEGRLMQALTLTDMLLEKQVVPYDSFALWLHYAEKSGQGGAPLKPPKARL
jgi:8-oxo-dGTP pyrophosphatase MutT (NUDIX family)